MIDEAMIWRKEKTTQSVLEAILEGAQYYRTKYGKLPNFVNVPPGRLSEAEIAQLRERWTVATDAPKAFPNDIWLGVMTPPKPPSNSPQILGSEFRGRVKTQGAN